MAEQAQYESAAGGVTAESVGSDSVPAGQAPEVSRGTNETGREASRRTRHGGGSLGDAVRDAKKAPATAKGATPAAAAVDPDAPKPWEPPAYAKNWKEQYRKAYEKFATHPELADSYKDMDGFFNELHQWDTKRSWEIGELRKNYQPIAPIIDQMRQQYQLQGMSLENGLGQLWGVAQRLGQDPDSTLAWLIQQYKPRDAAKFLQVAAQALGADLGQLAQAQPYVDPVVARQLAEAKRVAEQSQNAVWQMQQGQRQQQFKALYTHIVQFEQEKDASGNLKHPYAADIGQEMGLLLQSGRATSLEQAYEMAVKYHPKAQEERAKQAEQAAREAAARNTTDAEQAKAAARTVAGRPGGRTTRASSINDAVAMAEKSTYGRSR